MDFTCNYGGSYQVNNTAPNHIVILSKWFGSRWIVQIETCDAKTYLYLSGVVGIESKSIIPHPPQSRHAGLQTLLMVLMVPGQLGSRKKILMKPQNIILSPQAQLKHTTIEWTGMRCCKLSLSSHTNLPQSVVVIGLSFPFIKISLEIS